MTETELQPAPSPSTASWDTAFAALKSRYPKVKDSIVFCIHALQNDPDIDIDDLKAQAAMHGIRVTGASVTAAKRLMNPEAGSEAQDAEPATVVSKPKVRRGRPTRAAGGDVDAEAMLRQVVAKMQAQGSAEAERLRAAIRRVLAVLQAAVG